MAVRITVTDGTTATSVDVDVEPTTLVDDIIESAAAYWNKDPGAYLLNRGQTVLRGDTDAGQLGFQAGEVLTLIPDPTGGVRP